MAVVGRLSIEATFDLLGRRPLVPVQASSDELGNEYVRLDGYAAGLAVVAVHVCGLAVLPPGVLFFAGVLFGVRIDAAWRVTA